MEPIAEARWTLVLDAIILVGCKLFHTLFWMMIPMTHFLFVLQKPISYVQKPHQSVNHNNHY
jgi:hypothetical protein